MEASTKPLRSKQSILFKMQLELSLGIVNLIIFFFLLLVEFSYTDCSAVFSSTKASLVSTQ